MKANPVDSVGKLNPIYQAIDIRVKRDIVGRLKSPTASADDSIMSLHPLSHHKKTSKKVVKSKKVDRKEVLRRELITGWQKAKKQPRQRRKQ